MASEVNSLECNALKTTEGYICTVQIDKFIDIATKCEVGTSVSSDAFSMHLPDSFGDSSWVMQIYPNGQYGAGGSSNRHLSAYLKLISVENENQNLDVSIAFKVIGLRGFQFQLRRTMHVKEGTHCFNWSHKSARWYGGSLVKLKDLQYFGTVQIECHLNENKLKSTDYGKQKKPIPESPATDRHSPADTQCRNFQTPIPSETTDQVPAVQPPITGHMRKFPDVEKPTERIPEIPIVRNASSDIPYRNAPPNLQEITNKAPTTGVVQAAVKKIEETTKQENDTANDHEIEMEKISMAENFLMDLTKRSEQTSGESSDGDAFIGQRQPLHQSGVPEENKRNKSFLGKVYKAIFGDHL